MSKTTNWVLGLEAAGALVYPDHPEPQRRIPVHYIPQHQVIPVHRLDGWGAYLERARRRQP